MNKKEKLITIDQLLSMVEDIKLIHRQQEAATTRLESVLQSARAELVAKPGQISKKSVLSDDDKRMLMASLTKTGKRKT